MVRQFRWEEILFELASTEGMLREVAIEKFGETYFSAENHFGAPFALKVIIQH